jgi:hypothetical protein
MDKHAMLWKKQPKPNKQIYKQQKNQQANEEKIDTSKMTT